MVGLNLFLGDLIRGHYITNPKHCTIVLGNSFKSTIDFMAQSHVFWLEQKLTKRDFVCQKTAAERRPMAFFNKNLIKCGYICFYIQILKLKHLQVQDDKCWPTT